jgi:aconitate hydratase
LIKTTGINMNDSNDSFNSRCKLDVNGKQFSYYAVNGGELGNNSNVHRLPVSIKILLENLLRHEDGLVCSREDISALAASAGRSST